MLSTSVVKYFHIIHDTGFSRRPGPPFPTLLVLFWSFSHKEYPLLETSGIILHSFVAKVGSDEFEPLYFRFLAKNTAAF